MTFYFDLDNYKLHELLDSTYGEDADITDYLIGAIAMYLQRTLVYPLSNRLEYYIDRLDYVTRSKVVQVIDKEQVLDYRAMARTLNGKSRIEDIRHYGCKTFIIKAV